MIAPVTDAADLGVEDAAEALARRELSSRELVDACLARIGERDGTHSHDGDPDSDQRLGPRLRGRRTRGRRTRRRATRPGDAPTLCGIPIGLKDLYAVAGKPLTASSPCSTKFPTATATSGPGSPPRAWCCSGTCTRTSSPAAAPPTRSATRGRSSDPQAAPSGGSSAALASRQVPAATGTDTAGSLRIPSAECGTSTIKPTRGSVSMRGVVPLAWTFDHPGPMTRTVADSELAVGRNGGRGDRRASRRPLRRYAVSPRISVLEPDVADGLDRALAALPGERVEAPPPPGAARRPRRLLRPRPHRDARLPPSLRRSAGRVPPVEPGTARARRAKGDDGRGVHRAAGRPHRGHERVVRLVRRAPHRRDRRADDPDRRSLAGQRVRRGVRRHRGSLTHALLGLDGLSGRLPPVRRRAGAAGCP